MRWRSAVPSAITRASAITMTQSRDLLDHVHVVFDEHHGAHRASREAVMWVSSGLGEGGIDSGRGLIEHDQRRLHHQRSGHLEQLALTSGETTGVVVDHMTEPEPCERSRGPGPRCLVRRLAISRATAPPESLTRLILGGDQHVLEHGETGEGAGELEGPHYASPCDLMRQLCRRAGPPLRCHSPASGDGRSR